MSPHCARAPVKEDFIIGVPHMADRDNLSLPPVPMNFSMPAEPSA